MTERSDTTYMIDGCSLMIDEVSRHLSDCLADARQCEEGGMDVRLRVFDGGWWLNAGDAQYDDDHRGYWGAATLLGDETADDLLMLAEDLLEQCADDFAG